MATTKRVASGMVPKADPASPPSTSDSQLGAAGVRERIKQVASEARSFSDLVDSIANDPKLDELHKRGKLLLQLLGFKVE